MLKLKSVKPGFLSGQLMIPPSKSHTMRAILFGSLGRGKTRIHRYLNSPDTMAMISAMRQLGAHIEIQPETLIIQGVEGKLKASDSVIDVGNSGQVLRFVGALAALLPTYTVLTGDASIKENRPVQSLLDGITQLGGFAVSTRLNGKAPIIIQGPLKKGYASVAGEDSQPISALLIAASFLNGTTVLDVANSGEKPWIEMTLSWIKKMGGRVSHENYERYTITGPLSYEGFEITIPGDFSSAAFPLVSALLTQSSLTLLNLDMEDVQGDKKIIEILQKMGAKLEIDLERRELKILPSGTLKGMRIDVNEVIDALPILAVVGCFASGGTEIVNGAIARKKESDRIKTIASELRKMGGEIEERMDGLMIKPTLLRGAKLCSHADHRIAMALSVAAFSSEGDSFLEGFDCIEKSYPTFISDFQAMGALSYD